MSSQWVQRAPEDLDYDPVGGNRVVAVCVLALLLAFGAAVWLALPVLDTWWAALLASGAL